MDVEPMAVKTLRRLMKRPDDDAGRAADERHKDPAVRLRVAFERGRLGYRGTN